MSKVNLPRADKFCCLYIRVVPSKIAFLKFIIEGYDGLAILTTVDRHDGLVRLLAPQARHDELWRLLEELARKCRHHDLNQNLN